jgi:hypothetical protein
MRNRQKNPLRRASHDYESKVTPKERFGEIEELTRNSFDFWL